jgi:hypothetical protein
MADFPVKWFSSEFRGSPVVNGQAGSMVGLLDACLIHGFGEITPSSVVVSGGVATATHGAGDFFEDYAVIQISDADDGDLNGEARVISHTSTTTSWATEAGNGAQTGAIKIRYAPVGGWEIAFTDTNKRVYRSTALGANGFCLRVDDTNSTYALVRGFETMSDIESGSGPFPADAQMNNGGYWLKSSAANANANRWWFAGDGRFFMPMIAIGYGANSANLSAHPWAYGDAIALASGGDGYCSLLMCNANANVIQGSFASGQIFNASEISGAIFTPRKFDGTGGSFISAPGNYAGSFSSVSGASSGFGSIIEAPDGKIRFSRRFLKDNNDSTGYAPRADIPGFLFVMTNNIVEVYGPGDIIDGDYLLSDRKILMVGAGTNRQNIASGLYGVDITGPWR